MVSRQRQAFRMCKAQEFLCAGKLQQNVVIDTNPPDLPISFQLISSESEDVWVSFLVGLGHVCSASPAAAGPSKCPSLECQGWDARLYCSSRR